MADIKFPCWAKQTLHCPGQYINLHIPQAQRRINGQVEKNKMAGEEKLFEKLGSLVLGTISFPPSFCNCLPVNKFMLFILQFPLCIYSRGSTGIEFRYIPALQNDLKWLVLYQKYIKTVSKTGIVQFDTLSATKEKCIFTMLLKSPWILCHSWLYTVLLFKKPVLMDPSSGLWDLGGRAADGFFWVFGIHNI